LPVDQKTMRTDWKVCSFTALSSSLVVPAVKGYVVRVPEIFGPNSVLAARPVTLLLDEHPICAPPCVGAISAKDAEDS